MSNLVCKICPGHPAHSRHTAAVLVGTRGQRRAAAVGKTVYAGHDRLAALGEPELSLKRVGSQTQRVEWAQRQAAKIVCDPALLGERSCFCHFLLVLQEVA